MARLLEDWLQSYLEFTSAHEAPEKIHIWTAMAVLSASIRRQFYLDRVFYRLYPNLYVLIVAESARARKSIAMEIGLKLLKDAVPDVFVMRGRMTPEGLVKCMNRSKTVIGEGGRGTIYEDSHVFIYADELATLFGFDRQSASRMAMLLTEIYGSGDVYPHTTAGEGVWELHNLYPTVLAATDPRNLKVLPEEAIAGLLGRIVFIVAGDRRHSDAWLDGARKKETRELRTALVSDLQKISLLSGVIEPTEEARRVFSVWYDTINQKKIEDERIEPFLARCHDTALKIAMLISVSRSDKLKIEADHIAGGIAFVEKLLPESARVVHWTASTVFAQNRAHFLEVLRRHGGYCSRKVIMKALMLSTSDVDALVSTLIQEGTVEERLVGRDLMYRLAGEEP